MQKIRRSSSDSPAAARIKKAMLMKRPVDTTTVRCLTSSSGSSRCVGRAQHAGQLCFDGAPVSQVGSKSTRAASCTRLRHWCGLGLRLLSAALAGSSTTQDGSSHAALLTPPPPSYASPRILRLQATSWGSHQAGLGFRRRRRRRPPFVWQRAAAAAAPSGS